MANTNTTTSVVDTIFAQSLLALRQYSVMPRYVNRKYDTAPGAKMSTISVPIPSAIAAVAVTPSYVAPDDAGTSPTKVDIVLDKWYETAFFVNDKEVQEVVDGVFEGQLSEAVKGLANQVDNDILGLYTGVYGFAGAAGTTPLANGLDEVAEGNAVLTRQLAPKGDRFFVMDSNAEANAVLLRPLQDQGWRGPQAGPTLQEGELGRLLGALWAVDQNIPTHTAGTWTDAGTTTGANAAGQGVVNLTGGTGSILVGDIVTFSGADTQTYAVTAATGTAPTTQITVSPNLVTAKSSTETVTNKSTHVVNLLCHRDAFALAARPMEAADPFGLATGNRRSIMDPVSGLSLTMEISRQHYRTRIAMSSLYGVKLVRAALATRVAG
jgi:hypothetical protein